MSLLKVAIVALSLTLVAGCDQSGRKEARKPEPMPNLNRSPQPDSPNLPGQAPPLDKKAK